MSDVEVFNAIHYPACNERCVGDSHWLDNTGELRQDLPALVEVIGESPEWAYYERLTPPEPAP